MMDNDRLVALLNELIDSSVEHGADIGGSYASNEPRLLSAITNILEYLNLSKDYEIVKNDSLDIMWSNFHIVKRKTVRKEN